MARRSITTPRWTCWAHDERTYRLGRCEPLIVTGARHVLYEFATLADEPGHLPADDKKLASMVGLPLNEWLEIAESITTSWKRVGDEWLVERVIEEMHAAKLEKIRKKNAGKKGARNRWQPNDLNGTAIADPLAEPIAQPMADPVAPPMAEVYQSVVLSPKSPEEREEKQRGGPELRGAKPRHRALISEEREPEPEAADRLRELWPKEQVAEAMRASNETADAHRVGRADLNRWVVHQRQQRRHPRAVTAALKAATARGPSEIRNLTAWLSTTTTAESPNEHAKDAEGKAAGYKADTAATAGALFSGKAGMTCQSE